MTTPNFVDFPGTVTAATLSGSNGIQIGVATGTPNKITASLTDPINISGLRVGIGRQNPAVKLHVLGAVGETAELARFESNIATNDAFIRVKESSTEDTVLGSTSGTGFVGTSTNTPFALKTNNTNRVTLNTVGNVGIGNAPYSGPRLYIEGLDRWDTWNQQIYGDFYVGNSSNGLKMGIALGGGGAGTATFASQGGTNTLHIGAGTTQANQQTITITGGNVGIGKSPTEKLDVNGNIRANGIKFGSSVQYITDYQFGSWDPKLYGLDTTLKEIKLNTGYTSGRYLKIGHKIFLQANISVTDLSSSVGTVAIGNLPFVANNNAYSAYGLVTFSSYTNFNSSINSFPSGYTIYSTNFAGITKAAAGTTNVLNVSDLTNTSAFSVHINYETNI